MAGEAQLREVERRRKAVRSDLQRVSRQLRVAFDKVHPARLQWLEANKFLQDKKQIKNLNKGLNFIPAPWYIFKIAGKGPKKRRQLADRIIRNISRFRSLGRRIYNVERQIVLARLNVDRAIRELSEPLPPSIACSTYDQSMRAVEGARSARTTGLRTLDSALADLKRLRKGGLSGLNTDVKQTYKLAYQLGAFLNTGASMMRFLGGNADKQAKKRKKKGKKVRKFLQRRQALQAGARSAQRTVPKMYRAHKKLKQSHEQMRKAGIAAKVKSAESKLVKARKDLAAMTMPMMPSESVVCGGGLAPSPSTSRGGGGGARSTGRRRSRPRRHSRGYGEIDFAPRKAPWLIPAALILWYLYASEKR